MTERRAGQSDHFTSFIMAVALPIILGGMIYVLWRGETLLMFRWFKHLGLLSAIQQIRELVGPLATLLPRWVLCSLPDALWVFSFTVFMGMLWAPVSTRAAFFAMLFPLALGVGAEIGQAIGIVCGYFDMVDLILCSCSSSAGYLFVLHTKQKGALRYA